LPILSKIWKDVVAATWELSKEQIIAASQPEEEKVQWELSGGIVA
jgi:hypothetical protein